MNNIQRSSSVFAGMNKYSTMVYNNDTLAVIHNNYLLYYANDRFITKAYIYKPSQKRKLY